MHFRLSKEDSADIGFALACLNGGAIHFGEFKEWLTHVIAHCDDPPAYIFDMLDVKDRRDFKARHIMGFVSSSNLTDADYDAIAGVRFLRGISDLEDGITREKAIASLRAHPGFEKRITAFFPFLDLNRHVGADPDGFA